jgi:hypothetical protein
MLLQLAPTRPTELELKALVAKIGAIENRTE